jgi:hypothetical protein
MNRLSIAFLLVLTIAWPAGAQQLKLELKDGRVTLEANGVPARVILAEWAKVGGTKVVGGDKITGAPLTLKLIDMPERQALDIILRNVAGFMAAPRQASAAPGASTYDRILILASSSAPAQAAGNARPNAPGTPGSMVGSERRVPPRPANVPGGNVPGVQADPVEVDDQEPDDQADAATQPVFTFPAPPGSQPGNPVFVPVNPNNGGAFARPGQPGMVTTTPPTTAPMITLQPNPNGQPTIFNFVPSNEGQQQPPPPGQNGFTVIGSPTPGMIQQPAPTPGQPVRPPGQ